MSFNKTYNDQESLKLLKHLVDGLEKSNITYWIDTGTLLGFVREHNFIAWDGDIDLGIWEDQVHQTLQVLEEIFPRKEFYIEIKKADSSIQVFKINDISTRYIDITIYGKQGNNATRRWRTSNDENKCLFNLVGFIIESLYSAKTQRGHGANTFNKGNVIIKLMILLYNHTVIKLLSYIPDKDLKAFALYLYNKQEMYSNYIQCMIPLFFFENISAMMINNVKIKVPRQTTEYLTYRYGDDWYIPKTDYSYFTDDGAIQNKTYES